MDPTNSLSEDFADLSVRDSLTRISCERDQFFDDDHKRLDDELKETLGPNASRAALLSVITCGDERLVPLTFQGAAKLLSSQPWISKVLQKAWENKSFKEVRQLSQFFCCYPTSFQSP